MGERKSEPVPPVQLCAIPGCGDNGALVLINGQHICEGHYEVIGQHYVAWKAKGGR